jgi:cobalamin biosynthesis protein CbiG
MITTPSNLDRGLVLGVGCQRGTPPALFERGVLSVLAAHALRLENVHMLASIDRKATEPAVVAFADKHRIALRFYSAAQLEAAAASSAKHSVSEPAARLAAGNQSLLVPKTIYTEPGAEHSMTVAIAYSLEVST